MAYKKKSSFSKFSKYSKKGDKKSKQPITPRAATQTIKNYVNKMVSNKIANDIENKFTRNFQLTAPVCTLSTSTTGTLPNIVITTSYNWFTAPFGDSSANGGLGMFDLSCGGNQGERIGNKIKLKKWIIKGCVTPRQELVQGAGSNISGFYGATPSMMGYVDIYFGRYQLNIAPVNGGLTNFYQNGIQDLTPTGSQIDKLARVNNDLYKIYWHQRFKVGFGSTFAFNSPSPTTYIQYNHIQMPSGEGFKPTETFGFDACKYICSNRIIKYDELQSSPMDADIRNLTLWATFTPVVGDLGCSVAPSTGSPASIDTTFYKIQVLSYAEYEDA